MEAKTPGLIKLLLLAGFLNFLALPLILMLSSAGNVDIRGLLLSSQFKEAAASSVISASISTVISIILALAAVCSITQSHVAYKPVFNIILTVPMLIPSISNGMGIVILAGKNGILTRLLNIDFNIYGLRGIVVGSVLYSFPVAYLMLNDAIRYDDGAVYEAADVLGIPKIRQFFSLTMGHLKKPLINTSFTVFVMVFTDYGVPLIIGGQYRTLPVILYQDVIGLLDFGKGSVIALFLLLPASVAFVVDLYTGRKQGQSFICLPRAIRKSKRRDFLCYAYLAALLPSIILPIAAFTYLTFTTKYPIDNSFTLNNIIRSFDMGAGRYLLNSVYIAVLTGVIGVVLAYCAAYLTARSKGVASRTLHLTTMTSMAVPGMVLGISYVIAFNNSFLYGTYAIIIISTVVHFIAAPYLMAFNALSEINKDIEAVGATLGVSEIKIIKDVILPQSAATIAEMFAYFFINSMMTISAVSFLSTTLTKPVSLMISDLERQMLTECAAFISLLILLINLSVKLICGVIYAKGLRMNEAE